MKMYGGGMGDQIKRYCEKMEPEVSMSMSMGLGWSKHYNLS